MGIKEKMIEIEMDSITTSKANYRKTRDPKEMKELEESIKTKGILQPILVRPTTPGMYEIVCGERRFLSAQKVGLKKIPACVRDLDDKSVLEIQIIENSQRADVHPLEEAEGYERLMQHYPSTDDIAAKVGKSKSYVYKRIALLGLTSECRKMFYDGKLTASTALLIARIPKDSQKEAAKEITSGYDGPLSLNDARQVIQRDFMLDFKGVAFAKDDSICPEKGSCKTCHKRTINEKSLFDDVQDNDKCTDASCFNVKKAEYIKRQGDKAKKTGLEVLKTETVFRDGYSSYVGHGYVELKDTCYKDSKNRSYRELLKISQAIKPSVVVDLSGNIREVVKQSDADKALKDAGIKFDSGSSGSGSSEDKKDRDVRARVTEQMIGIIMDRIRADKKDSFWGPFVMAAIRGCSSDKALIWAKHIDKSAKRTDSQDILRGSTLKLSDGELRNFILRFFLYPDFNGFHDYPTIVTELCDHYDIDIKDAEEEVRAEVSTTKKAKK